MSADRLFDISHPTPRCKDCLAELTGRFDREYGQCLPCNHREVEQQLLGVLRGWWREHPEKRDLIQAWADYTRRMFGGDR